MPQFDVYRLADGSLVLDCQADTIGPLDTRLVAPLEPVPDDARLMPRLHPRLSINGEDHVLLIQLASAVLKRELRVRLMSLAEHEYTIKGALDMLISGF